MVLLPQSALSRQIPAMNLPVAPFSELPVTPSNPNIISLSSYNLEELSVSPSAPLSQQQSVQKTRTIQSLPKPNYISSFSSTLDELSVSPSAPSSQKLLVLKTHTVPLSSSNLEELSFLPSTPISTAFSQLAPSEPLDTPSAPISKAFSHSALSDLLDAPAVIDSEWQAICNFNSFLAQSKLEECVTCKKRWFDMKLLNGVCRIYCGSNIQKKLYSQSNNGDVSFLPHNLPHLSEIEEILIARANVLVQVQQIKGQQFSYSGHTVNFMQNVTKVYRKLPLLLSDLDIILLKQALGSGNDNRAINQRLEQIFRVQRERIRIWLGYLQKNHSDYQNIIIDSIKLSALLEDGSIHFSLLTLNNLPEAESLVAQRNFTTQGNLQTFDGVVSPPDTVSVVPDLHLAETELFRLQQNLKGQSVQDFLSSNENELVPEQRLSFPTFLALGLALHGSSR